MDFRYDAVCGLYCGACDVLQANRDGAVEAVAQAWGMDPEQLRCHGCQTDVNSVYCLECGIKACARNREVAYCFQCQDYPCPRLVAFRNDECPHHSVVLQNLERLRRQGLETWLEEQRARWSCPECGAGHTWYDTACRACGGRLTNCKDEESHIVDQSTGDR